MMRTHRMVSIGLTAILLSVSLISAGCSSAEETADAETSPVAEERGDEAGYVAETVIIDGDISEKSTTLATETAAAMTETNDTIYVTGDWVNIRSSASMSADVVDLVSRGTALTRTGYNDEWCRIDIDGRELYISSSFVSSQEPETTAAAALEAGPGDSSGSGSYSDVTAVTLNPSWKYADYSKINSGTAYLYRSDSASRKGITVCVNAGHGTSGGSSVSTLCHPDGSPKVTGGSTAAGATTATAVSAGMNFNDGTAESKVTLALANVLKDKLLAAGYDVLMTRTGDDVQLDNIARTVIANNMADCHIALHWDSTDYDKGAFYCSVPSNSSYRSMEPVASHWQSHNALGSALISGLQSAGVKIFSSGSMEMDLTQTSYSTVPSVDIELGDKASDHSDATLNQLANGLLAGINQYFGQ